MAQLRIAIAGATGYAGEELIRILLQHPHVSLTHLAASAKWTEAVALGTVYPRYARHSDLSVQALDPDKLANSADLVFLALPHGVSLDIVPSLRKAGLRVVDLGADYRLQSAAAFEQWYQKPHTHPNTLGEAVYGLTEWMSEEVGSAQLVANPGCYATSILLALMPAVQAGWITDHPVIVDAKSGITGAGRGAKQHLLFGEMNENSWAYKVNSHQHLPEIEQSLAHVGTPPSICFVPQVLPAERGISSMIYIPLNRPMNWGDVNAVYEDAYADAPFVRLKKEGEWPQLRHVQRTNYCDLAYAVDNEKGLLIVNSMIDNLVKGAAGQAVQNMNVMCGFDECEGLK